MIYADQNPIRVLVVDDDELVLTVLHTALVRAGYSVRDATDSAMALRMLAIQPVDVMVLDAHMQGPTLAEDLESFRSLSHSPAIIVLSGAHVDAGLLKQFQATYLAKPVDASVFLERVAQAASAHE